MMTSQEWRLEREAAERYEEILVPTILGPAAHALVAWANLQEGDVVVDVGCGTGAAARFAAEQVGPEGQVMGVDVNPAMVEVARSLPPVAGAPIEWYVRNAYDLPFREHTVDVVLCAQMLQFLTERPVAISQMARILKSGGRIALSCWSPLHENPYFHALVEVISRYIGSDTAAGLGAAFALSNPREIETLLVAADFDDVQVTEAELALELPPLTAFIPRHISATPMAAAFEAAPVETKSAIVRDVANQFTPDPESGRTRVPFRTYFASGRR